MARNYNREIAEAVKRLLDEDGWHYNFDSENGLFRFNLTLIGKLKNVQYFICINDSDYIVYVVSPLSADRTDPEQMMRMAEFVCRVNYGLRDGNYEMDFEDGELRYKYFVNCEGSMPNRAMIKKSILYPQVMYERFGNGILMVLFSNMPVGEAVRQCKETWSAPVAPSDGEVEKPSRVLGLLRRLQGGQSGFTAQE